MPRTTLTATAVWRITPELVLALAEHLGTPVDSYMNGTQTWLTEEPPNGSGDDLTFEWRLHPVAAFRPPTVSPYDLWDAVVGQLVDGVSPETLHLGTEERPLESLWDGLECFCPYGEELEPAGLAATTTARLGVGPDGAGLVDHDRIGSAWERSRGGVSLVNLLFEELGGAT